MVILEDVALDRMIISDNGRDIRFEFQNFGSPDIVNVIECDHICVLKYHNNFQDNDDDFPAIIVEVTTQKVFPSHGKKWFSDHNYGFRDINYATVVPFNDLFFFLHIEGGSIDIDVACETLKLNGKLFS